MSLENNKGVIRFIFIIIIIVVILFVFDVKLPELFEKIINAFFELWVKIKEFITGETFSGIGDKATEHSTIPSN